MEATLVRNYTVVEVPKSLHQEIKPYAVSMGKSVKAVVIQALENFIQSTKEGGKK